MAHERRRVVRRCVQLLCEERGQDLIEYALLAATIGIAGAGIWGLIGTSLGNAYASYDTGQQQLWEPPPPPSAP